MAAAWNLEGLPENIGETGGWSFERSSAFPIAAKIAPSGNPASAVLLETTHTFTKPGTYFPTLRVASQRQGDAATPYTRIQNLDRARVVVK